MNLFPGKRVYMDGNQSNLKNPGEYEKRQDGTFRAITPNGIRGNLRSHIVIEHNDETISVSPSILVEGETSWHGYLVKGIWEEI